MVQKGPAGCGWDHALAGTRQQGGPQSVFHATNPCGRRRERQGAALGARCYGAGVQNVAEKFQVGEIKSHASSFAKEDYDKYLLRGMRILSDFS